ncbi:MAG: hypothetical protein ACYC2K_13910 [Gemmatimonadales bacterium]
MTRTLQYGLIGAVVGLVVLGGGSRALMRGVTLITSSTPIYTLSGTAEILVSGAVYGALGGILLAVLPRRRTFWRPWLHWLIFLAAIMLLSATSRAELGALAEQARVPVLAAFSLLVLIYSLILSVATRRADRAG